MSFYVSNGTESQAVLNSYCETYQCTDATAGTLTLPRGCTDINKCCMDETDCVFTPRIPNDSDRQLFAVNQKYVLTEQDNKFVFNGLKGVSACRIGDAYQGYSNVRELQSLVNKSSSGILECGKIDTTSMENPLLNLNTQTWQKGQLPDIGPLNGIDTRTGRLTTTEDVIQVRNKRAATPLPRNDPCASLKNDPICYDCCNGSSEMDDFECENFCRPR